MSVSVRIVSAHSLDPEPQPAQVTVNMTGERLADPLERRYVIDGLQAEDTYIQCLEEVLISLQSVDIVTLDPAEDGGVSLQQARILAQRLIGAGASGVSRIISTVDVVVLTLDAGVLKVGLLKRARHPYAGRYALPGSFLHLDADASTTDAARRVMAQVGVKARHVEQICTVAGPGRDVRGQNGWAMSVVHLALIGPADMARSLLTFHPVDSIPSLAFDHADLICSAIERFIGKSAYSSMMMLAMDDTFQMADLISAYSTLLDRQVDQSSFRRKMADRDILVTVTPSRGSASAARYALKTTELIIFDKPVV